MNLFETVQRYMAAMGFFPNQQQNKRSQFNNVQISGILLYVIDAILYGAYIICVADTVEEYVNSIFTLTVALGFAIAYISLIFKNDKLFDIIDGVADELMERKCYMVTEIVKYRSH